MTEAKACNKEAELADVRARVSDLERRCDTKEKQLRTVEAWQNRAIGYTLAFSAIASLAVNKLLEKL